MKVYLVTILYLVLMTLSVVVFVALFYWRIQNKNDVTFRTRFCILLGYFILLNSFLSLVWVLSQTINLDMLPGTLVKNIIVRFSNIDFITALLGTSFLLLSLHEKFVIPLIRNKGADERE